MHLKPHFFGILLAVSCASQKQESSPLPVESAVKEACRGSDGVTYRYEKAKQKAERELLLKDIVEKSVKHGCVQQSCFLLSRYRYIQRDTVTVDDFLRAAEVCIQFKLKDNLNYAPALPKLNELARAWSQYFRFNDRENSLVVIRRLSKEGFAPASRLLGDIYHDENYLKLAVRQGSYVVASMLSEKSFEGKRFHDDAFWFYAILKGCPGCWIPGEDYEKRLERRLGSQQLVQIKREAEDWIGETKMIAYSNFPENFEFPVPSGMSSKLVK